MASRSSGGGDNFRSEQSKAPRPRRPANPWGCNSGSEVLGSCNKSHVRRRCSTGITRDSPAHTENKLPVNPEGFLPATKQEHTHTTKPPFTPCAIHNSSAPLLERRLLPLETRKEPKHRPSAAPHASPAVPRGGPAATSSSTARLRCGRTRPGAQRCERGARGVELSERQTRAERSFGGLLDRGGLSTRRGTAASQAASKQPFRRCGEKAAPGAPHTRRATPRRGCSRRRKRFRHVGAAGSTNYAIPPGQTHCLCQQAHRARRRGIRSRPNPAEPCRQHTAPDPLAAPGPTCHPPGNLREGTRKARLPAGQRGHPTCGPELETGWSSGRSCRAQASCGLLLKARRRSAKPKAVWGQGGGGDAAGLQANLI